MSQKFNPQDHYFKQAKKDGFVARSAYKLEEIDKKFTLFGPKTKTVIDIGCAPGSRLQYVSRKLSRQHHNTKIIGFDLKKVDENYPGVSSYQQDITDIDAVKKIITKELSLDAELDQTTNTALVDVIISDMAPDTLGHSGTDALRSISLIYDTMWMYEQLLKKEGKFVIKVFMGPGFEDLLTYCRDRRGNSAIKIFKPKSCRDISKETYIIKV